jgi:transposase
MKVVEYHKAGNTQDETALKFRVGSKSVENWSKEFDSTNDIRGTFDTSNRKAKKIDGDKLKQMVKENPSIMLKDIAHHFDCSAEAARLALKRHKITRKKK